MIRVLKKNKVEQNFCCFLAVFFVKVGGCYPVGDNVEGRYPAGDNVKGRYPAGDNVRGWATTSEVVTLWATTSRSLRCRRQNQRSLPCGQQRQRLGSSDVHGMAGIDAKTMPKNCCQKNGEIWTILNNNMKFFIEPHTTR